MQGYATPPVFVEENDGRLVGHFGRRHIKIWRHGGSEGESGKKSVMTYLYNWYVRENVAASLVSARKDKIMRALGMKNDDI